MWSALSTIGRDLTEFASVVSSDAAQLINAAATVQPLLGSTASDGHHHSMPTAGDEDFPEVIVLSQLLQQLPDDATATDHLYQAISDLQSTTDTFQTPLTDEEQQQWEASPNYSKAMDRGRWQLLLNSSADMQECYEECIGSPAEEGDDDAGEGSATEWEEQQFFSRYFWRLSQVRAAALRDISTLLQQQRRHGSGGGQSGGGATEDTLEGWDDVITSGDTTAAPSTTSIAAGGSTRRGDNELASYRQQQADMVALRRRVSELEAEVARLQAENRLLRNNNNKTVPESDNDASHDVRPQLAPTTEVVANNNDTSATRVNAAPQSPPRHAASVVGSSRAEAVTPAPPPPSLLQPKEEEASLPLVQPPPTTASNNNNNSRTTAAVIQTNVKDEDDDDDWTKLS